jgi:major membrane immunogen (membrane-anchored lipoprotein)
MKTSKQFGLVLLLSLTALVTSCSSSDSSGGGFSGPATGTFVKAKVDGTAVLAEGQFANGGYNGGNLVLQGFSLDGKSVNIQIYAMDGTLDVGTYDLSTANTEDVVVGGLSLIDVNTSSMTSATYSSNVCTNTTGTVQITFVDDTKIEGTFSFNGKEVKENDDCSGGTKSITEGSFRLEL